MSSQKSDNMRSRQELAFVSVQRLCLEQEAKKGAFGEVDPREAAASRVRRAEQDLNRSQHALLMAQEELERVPASNPPQASRVATPGRIKSYVAEKWVTMTKRVTKISDTFIAAHIASSEETYRGTPRALPVHIDHNAHLEVNFADAEGGGDCDDGRFASPRSSGAAATASPLGGTNHPRGSTGQGASASAELEPGGAAQEPGECAMGRQVRGYVRLNDLNPQEREQHAAEKHAKKIRDRRDRRAAKRQRTAGPQTASSCADDSSEH